MGMRIGVIGAGIVGVAIARALAVEHGRRIMVIEKEQRVAAHQTGRNSGVVHAGIYYEPGSLKARLCARGRELTRDYCAAHSLPYLALGKLVVATGSDELTRLDALETRARANGVPDLRRVDAAGIESIEPHARGLAALHSPHTAVVDYAAITESMADELRGHGGEIVFGSAVTGIGRRGRGVVVTSGDREWEFDRVVVCAGLHSDELAVAAGADASPRILPFRGEYRELVEHRRELVRGLIYPVPDPRFPFLGVHFTRGVDGSVRIGPNAVPALAREGYRRRDVSVSDTLGSLGWPGAPVLLRRHWRMAVKELSGSLVKPLYYRDARRFVPELRMRDLTAKSTPGVRAQAWDRRGDLLDDFVIDQLGPITLLRNAPSPAATSAMAIAEHVIREYSLG